MAMPEETNGPDGPATGPTSLAAVTYPSALRVGTWPHDPTVALIVATDFDRDIDPSHFATQVDIAVTSGARLVRTGALHSQAATVATDIGFVVIDELLLLERPVERQLRRRSEHRLRALRSRHLAAASMVDLRAFGPRWTHDAPALAEAIEATPLARARRSSSRHRPVTGFAISGISGSTGYLQRLAVEPAVRRTGVATTLVDDALSWMGRRGVDRVLVNTSVANVPAIALYESLGFARLNERLVVAEFDPSRGSS